jgi:uncharacterized protein YciI
MALLDGKSTALLRDDLLTRHIDHLKKLAAQGVLYLCGPLENENFSGAMQVLTANSFASAEEYVKMDPIVSEGYYSRYTLYEWRESDETNNWLRDT